MGIKRWAIRLSAIAAVTYATTFAYVFGFASNYKNPAQPRQVDMIVCLGGGAYPDGSLAPSSTGRALECADLYAQGAAPRVLFTGANGNPAVKSAARAMADLAIQNGVPPDAILLEEASRSTLQNALFSAPQMTDADTILLVTQGFHLPRSRVSFAAIGPWDITIWMSGPHIRRADGTIGWWALHRETLAIWFNLARYSLWWTGQKLGLQNIDGLLT